MFTVIYIYALAIPDNGDTVASFSRQLRENCDNKKAFHVFS